jgi:YD repeat-containing protein
VRRDDEAGGFRSFSRTFEAAGRSVVTETGGGRLRGAGINRQPTGSRQILRTSFAGLETMVEQRRDASESRTTPDGTAVEKRDSADPRLGLVAPVPEDLDITTPGGLHFSRTQTRAATTDPLTGFLQSQTDTITVNGRASTVAWDGIQRVTTTTTAAGRLLEDTLDAFGRLSTTQVDGLEAVRLGYDARGRLASLAQGAGADERVVSFSYDALGNLASVTDPLLRTVSFQYDPAGRVIRQTLPDARFIDFAYDARGNLTSLTPPGQPAHVFRYTLADQESEYEPPDLVPGDPRTIFTYDLDQNLVQVDRPDGASIVLTYDTGNRLSTVTTPRGTTTQTYHPSTGNITSIQAPGGVSAQRTPCFAFAARA